MSEQEAAPQWPRNEAQCQAFVLFCAGFEEQEISARTGVNRNTLATWKHRGNWKQLQEDFRKDQESKNPRLIEKMIVRSGEPKERIIERFNNARENMAGKVADVIDKMDGDEIVIDSRNLDTALKMSERALGLDREEDRGGANISLTFLTGDSEGVVKVVESRKSIPAVEDAEFSED